MIEDFEPLNSVVRSRQFFLRSVKDTRHFFVDAFNRYTSIIYYSIFFTYVRAMVWVRVRLSGVRVRVNLRLGLGLSIW